MTVDPTLLLVDDNALLREMLCEILRMIRPTWQVLEASNGAEGVALAKVYRPDIIFMDLNMPIMNGYTAAVQMRATATLRDIPIVLMTSEDLSAPLVVQTSKLCQAVLAKPFAVKEMERLLTRLLGSVSARKSSPPANFAVPLLDVL